MGFQGVIAKMAGRPRYHPSILLKIYIYGYLNRIQSSRRLERETHRNVELMWLTSRLTPDFKTIADFRKNNGKAIQQVCKEFVLICRRLDLLSHDIVTVDGSILKAVNTRDKSFSKAKIKIRKQEVEDSIDRYLKDLDAADKEAPSGSSARVEQMKDKLARLKLQLKGLEKIKLEMEESEKDYVSLTDPDSRLMKGGQGIQVAYNVQTVVDSKYHLIPAHEVTTEPSDRKQLFNMSMQAKEIMNTDSLSVLADAGYYKGSKIKACQDESITCYLPKPQTSGNKSKGLFGREDFKFNVEDDAYTCPTGEYLTRRTKTKDKTEGKKSYRYWTNAWGQCPIKSKCTTSKESKTISLWEHESIIDDLSERMLENPEMMKVRKQTIEHPFGTIKQWMGATHFQMRRLKNVKTEMSLHILAYNIKRVINILGIKALMAEISV
ncbi:MAG: transposase [Candidatus Azotimanducaceae bacterium]|jgi:transposase